MGWLTLWQQEKKTQHKSSLCFRFITSRCNATINKSLCNLEQNCAAAVRGGEITTPAGKSCETIAKDQASDVQTPSWVEEVQWEETSVAIITRSVRLRWWDVIFSFFNCCIFFKFMEISSYMHRFCIYMNDLRLVMTFRDVFYVDFTVTPSSNDPFTTMCHWRVGSLIWDVCMKPAGPGDLQWSLTAGVIDRRLILNLEHVKKFFF